MSDKSLRLILGVLILCLSAAVVIQGFSNRAFHQQICDSQNAGLTVLHDVIVIASRPPPGKTYTRAQAIAVARFEAATFARIGAARCH